MPIARRATHVASLSIATKGGSQRRLLQLETRRARVVLAQPVVVRLRVGEGFLRARVRVDGAAEDGRRVFRPAVRGPQLRDERLVNGLAFSENLGRRLERRRGGIHRD